MKRFLLALILVPSSFLFAQDTLTIMTYNLLNYPNAGHSRVNDLKVILQYVKPDIFICSEVDNGNCVQGVLDTALNVAPINYYAACTYMDGPDTDNMLFYNTNKVTLASQNQISTALRDISHYHLYTCESTDTVWFDVFSAHLKASQGTTYANDRLAEVTHLTNYIATMPTNTNIIFGGDFNFYGATVEPAWNQLTVTCVQPFKDPLNMVGDWHSDAAYKHIHTQSTRSSANSGCCGGSTGGLDDRFDFLLINQNLRDGIEGAQYVTGTYKSIGNDGNHFNKAVIESPTNSSVPASVCTSLFNMSDHLPVMMKVATCDVRIGIEENAVAHHLSLAFPAENQMQIRVNYFKAENIQAEILTLNGAVVASSAFTAIAGENQFDMALPVMDKGMYILRLTSASGTVVHKFVK